MALLDKLTADMKVAMKAKEAERLSTIRFLLNDVKNALTEKGTPLSEAEEMDILTRQAKRRRESIDAFTKAGRQDLADKERAELVVIEAYLPQQLSADEARQILREVIAEVGATSRKDVGKVMSAVMPKLKGRFPGKDVKPLMEELLPPG